MTHVVNKKRNSDSLDPRMDLIWFLFIETFDDKTINLITASQWLDVEW